ncbi:MAG: hypothetical protein L0323_22825 [Planctomycetes bacterium]|nr:hypothetical protein [Planctomycetota bacterium]
MNRFVRALETRCLHVFLVPVAMIGWISPDAGARQFPPPPSILPPPFIPPLLPPPPSVCDAVDVQVNAPNLIPLGVGTTSVAIRSNSLFNTTNISSVELNGVPGFSPDLRDVNGDGNVDLVFLFRNDLLSLTAETTSVVVTFAVQGTAVFCIVPVTVVCCAVSTSVTLHLVNHPHDPAACAGGALTCKGALPDAEVRLFEWLPPNESPWDSLVAEYASQTHISGATTDSEGTCFLGVPSAGEYRVIVRWFDPTQGVYAYVGHRVGAEEFVDGLAVRPVGLHKTLRNDGTVHYANAEVASPFGG